MRSNALGLDAKPAATNSSRPGEQQIRSRSEPPLAHERYPLLRPSSQPERFPPGDPSSKLGYDLNGTPPLLELIVELDRATCL